VVLRKEPLGLNEAYHLPWPRGRCSEGLSEEQAKLGRALWGTEAHPNAMTGVPQAIAAIGIIAVEMSLALAARLAFAEPVSRSLTFHRGYCIASTFAMRATADPIACRGKPVNPSRKPGRGGAL
jgi:hypothetical protein